MARKTVADLRSTSAFKIAQKSWAALGWDTSMTSVAVVGVGFDGITKQLVGPAWAETRWMPEDDYYLRLAQASNAKDLAFDVLQQLWVIDSARVWMAFEEPWYYGAVKQQQSAWLKQQAEVAGAVKGGLAKYGFKQLHEINNQQWKHSLREEGVPLLAPNRKDPDMKWKVKRWAIEWGMPDVPDLVKDRSGAKIPRPASGYGAKAKPIQPNDIYDAAAICFWMREYVIRYLGSVNQGGS